MSPRVSAERREEYQENRRNQILDAAVVAFGDQGLDHATMDDIAQVVGISKATIYLYFKSKEEVFDAILTERSSMPQIVDLMDALEGPAGAAELPLQALLERMSERYLSAMDRYHPLLRLLLADSHKSPVQAEHVYNNIFLKVNQKLAELLAAQAKAGKIRKLDSPLITARCFMGMLLIYVLSQEMLGGNKFAPIKREDWVKETVRLFLHGIQISKK